MYERRVQSSLQTGGPVFHPFVGEHTSVSVIYFIITGQLQSGSGLEAGTYYKDVNDLQ